MKNPKTEIITVLGQRGSGKTTWVKNQLRNIPRFIVWDTLGEYTGFKTIDRLDDLLRAVARNGLFQIVYNSIDDEDLETVCKIAGAARNLYLIIEEVDAYATPSVCPDELKALLKRGRHWGVSMIFVSRRPAEINRLITSQSQRFVLFRMFEPSDIRYLRAIVGPAASDLPELEPLHYIDWQHGRIERGVVKIFS